MKYVMLVLFSILITLSCACTKEPPVMENHAGNPAVLKDQKDNVSYTMGVDIGNNIKQLGYDVELDLVFKGIADKLSGNKLLLTEEEMANAKDSIQDALTQIQQERLKRLGEENKQAGADFLAQQKKEKDVVALESGLLYKILTPGNGRNPAGTDVVTVHYRGSLIDGTEVFSSYRNEKPKSFPVKAVFPGWQEGLKHMREGAKHRLFIPAELAYGEHGASMPGGPQIGPNAALIMDVELIAIK